MPSKGARIPVDSVSGLRLAFEKYCMFMGVCVSVHMYLCVHMCTYHLCSQKKSAFYDEYEHNPVG